jgi:hypothetical protein
VHNYLCRIEFWVGLDIQSLLLAHSRNKSGDSVPEKGTKGIKKNKSGDSVLKEAQARNRNEVFVPNKAEETRKKNKSGIPVPENVQMVHRGTGTSVSAPAGALKAGSWMIFK